MGRESDFKSYVVCSCNLGRRRLERGSERVKREISFILKELKDPSFHNDLISVVCVKLSRDFSVCSVYLSSLKGFANACKIAKLLQKKVCGFVRYELSKRLHGRSVPVLKFLATDSIEYGVNFGMISYSRRSGRNDFGCIFG
ncbi:MAG: 30S ribosome-binding factor RbfA [Oscillospiraceae bacterium]|jgi:ribosome-binding factor A|nr:30S ribosome-binding factor RbfA [Oscillospiraceae bacterium]